MNVPAIAAAACSSLPRARTTAASILAPLCSDCDDLGEGRPRPTPLTKSGLCIGTRTRCAASRGM